MHAQVLTSAQLALELDMKEQHAQVAREQINEALRQQRCAEDATRQELARRLAAEAELMVVHTALSSAKAAAVRAADECARLRRAVEISTQVSLF
jgi:hypothetical protein